MYYCNLFGYYLYCVNGYLSSMNRACLSSVNLIPASYYILYLPYKLISVTSFCFRLSSFNLIHSNEVLNIVLLTLRI